METVWQHYRLPPFRYEFIQEHLVEKSETMPDNRPTGAYRQKKMGYRLFKENYGELGLSTVPDDKSCTDVLQQWNVPKNSNVSFVY